MGFCSVLVRSVSPCRLVLEVRSFPSPPALFWPFARRLCPLFSSSCLSGLTRLRPGVCVWHLNRCKTSLLFFLLSSPFLITQGATAPFISPWPTKLLMFGEDMQSDQLHVPAFSDIARVLFNLLESGLDSIWQHWMLYIVFEKYYKGIYFRSNCLGWFACYRTQFLTDLFKDPFLSSVWIVAFPKWLLPKCALTSLPSICLPPTNYDQ